MGEGHVGRAGVGTMALIPQVADAVRIPVVAAGGIADGRGCLAAFALGAEGIQMGTRFLATEECAIPLSYKKAILEARDDGTMIAAQRGLPLRVLKNKAACALRALDEKGAGQEEINAFVDEISRGPDDPQNKLMSAGQSCGMIRSVVPVETLIANLVLEVGELAATLGKKLCRL
jgi:enoyl-[acyl-carrier protein] reductase II